MNEHAGSSAAPQPTGPTDMTQALLPSLSVLPSLFLSHGAPTLPLTDTPARAFLQRLGGELPRPAAILVVSAHWETAVPTVNAVKRNDTIRSLHGFPDCCVQRG